MSRPRKIQAPPSRKHLVKWVRVPLSAFYEIESGIPKFVTSPTGNSGPYKFRATCRARSLSSRHARGFIQARGMSKYLAIFAILLFCQLVAAQFAGFFEHMFQGEHPGRQQRRPPGADHWRVQGDAGEFLPVRAGDIADPLFATSSLFYVSLSRYPGVRGYASTMPLSERGRYQVHNPRRARQDCWHGGLCEGWRLRRRR